MSDHSSHDNPPPAPEFFDYKHIGGRFLGVAAVAFVFLILSFVLGWFEAKQFAFSWLFAFYVFFTICMGGLFWVLVHHAVDAEWSVVVRRQLENIAGLLPVMAALFVPLIFVAPKLWYWMTYPEGKDPILDEKAAYLNEPFFWIRAVFYFVFFTAAAILLKKFSVKQDASGSPKYTVWNRRLTFASLPLFAVALTFAAVDWLMGLDFHWFSTMWGVYIFAGSALSSMAVLILLVTALRSVGYLQNVITVEHYHIMGKLLFAFTVFWAYISFSQYMLIWYANIPEETVYYLIRNVGSWNTLNIILVIGHFWIPFLLLLPCASKRNPAFLCGVAIWILLMHVLDVYIIVLPALHKTGFSPSPLDLICLVAIGATLIAVFLKKLGDTSLFPPKDPRLEGSLRLLN
jgi:hypothetical protein